METQIRTDLKSLFQLFEKSRNNSHNFEKFREKLKNIYFHLKSRIKDKYSNLKLIFDKSEKEQNHFLLIKESFRLFLKVYTHLKEKNNILEIESTVFVKDMLKIFFVNALRNCIKAFGFIIKFDKDLNSKIEEDNQKTSLVRENIKQRKRANVLFMLTVDYYLFCYFSQNLEKENGELITEFEKDFKKYLKELFNLIKTNKLKIPKNYFLIFIFIFKKYIEKIQYNFIELIELLNEFFLHCKFFKDKHEIDYNNNLFEMIHSNIKLSRFYIVKNQDYLIWKESEKKNDHVIFADKQFEYFFQKNFMSSHSKILLNLVQTLFEKLNGICILENDITTVFLDNFFNFLKENIEIFIDGDNNENIQELMKYLKWLSKKYSNNKVLMRKCRSTSVFMPPITIKNNIQFKKLIIEVENDNDKSLKDSINSNMLKMNLSKKSSEILER